MMSKKDTYMETHLKLIPDDALKCVWMSAGVIKYRLCDRNHDCDNCPLDRAMKRGLPEEVTPQEGRSSDKIKQLVEGFLVPDELFFHQGHTWVRAESEDTATLGIDDFAQKLIGKVEHVKLPPVGSTLRQSDAAWTIYLNYKSFDMLSPLDGKVNAINTEVLKSPMLINEDPYGKGWLIKVQSDRLNVSLKNLLSAKLAKMWTEVEVEKLFLDTNYSLGRVRFDGGFLVDGIAKSLDPSNWDKIVKRYLLIGE